MPTHNIVPHISLHDPPCHTTMKKYEYFGRMEVSLFHLQKFAIQTWFCNCPQYFGLLRIDVEYRLCSSGSSRLSPSGSEAHPGANTFPSVCGLTATSFTDPSASRNTFSVSTITDGNARIGGRSTFPALTLSLTVHRAVSVRRSTTGR